MSNINNILIAGVGGQGVVLSSDIVVHAGLESGFDVKKSEIPGMSQRGGPVLSHVRMGDKIYSPVIPRGEADLLVSLEEMETLRWINYAAEKTVVIYSAQNIIPSGIESYPEQIRGEIHRIFKKVISVDPQEIKNNTGSFKYMNTVLLGILSNFVDINEDCWTESIKSLVPEKTFKNNINAFKLGKSINSKSSRN